MPTANFKTVEDMQAVPVEKIDAFCEDLRLWLHAMKACECISEAIGPDHRLITDRSTFGWIDDGKHDANIKFVPLAPDSPMGRVEALMAEHFGPKTGRG